MPHSEIPTDYECPECSEEMEVEDEGDFYCPDCDLRLVFYIEDGKLFADEF